MEQENKEMSHFIRAPDDSFSLVDGLHRSILGALGNSIVPQVATQIMKAIKEAGVK